MAFDNFEGYELVHIDLLGCVCGSCGANEPVSQSGDGENDGRTAFGRLLKTDLIDILKEGGVTDLDWIGDSEAKNPGKMVLELQRQTTGEDGADASGDGLSDEIRSDEQQASATPNSYDSDLNDADQAVDGLIGSSRWNTTDLSFGFASTASDYESNYYDATAVSTVTALSVQAQNVARSTFDQYSAISGLRFTEYTNAGPTGQKVIDADLRLAQSSKPGTAYAYYPSTNSVGGDSFYGAGKYNTPVMGNYQYHTILHEIGHALGLKHGHETSGPGAVPYELDSMEFTVMTYRSYVGKDLSYGYANETWGFAQSLMMLDIAAIQRMYGANFDTNAGDSIYTFSTTTGEMFVNGAGMGTPGGNRVFRTVWDGNGNDTYSFANYTTDLAIDLAPGGYSDLDTNGNFQRAMLDFGYGGTVVHARGHLFNAMQYNGDARSLIENAIGGSGNDLILGNAANNRLEGGAGNDTLVDSAGDDTYLGGAGTDEVQFSGAYADYSFSLAGAFLQVVDTATDWIEDTIEWLLFSDGQRSFADVASLIDPVNNTAPNAVNDLANAVEDQALVIAVLANDSDAEGNALSVSAVAGQAISVGQTVTLASGARVTLNADGTLSYDQNGVYTGLNEGESAQEVFGYTVTDGLATSTASVTVTITGLRNNSAPVAVADSARVAEDAGLTIAVLANDTDVDGDTLTIATVAGQAVAVGQTVTLASGARVTLNADGTLGYDQNGAFDSLNVGQTGQDSFVYTVTDGIATSQATVTVTIDGAFDNSAPVAVDDSNRGNESAVLTGNVLANDSDVDGDVLSVIGVNGAAPGSTITLASGATVTMQADGSYSYDTNGAFDGLETGQTATDSFTYTVSDGAGGIDTATVRITIDGVSPPSMENAFVVDFEGVPTGAYLGENGLNATGVETVASAALEGSRAGLVQPGVDAVLSFGAGSLDLDSAGFASAGDRVRIIVTALDDAGAVLGTQTINLRPGRIDVRSFDATFDNADKIVISGNASFYIDSLSVVTRVTGEIGGNLAPTASNDAFSVASSVLLEGNLLGDNGFGPDTDPEGDTLSVVSVEGDSDGSVTLASGAVVTFLGNGSFTYDQAGAFDGLYEGQTATDSFSYTITDGKGGFDTATATVEVQGAGAPPPSTTTTVDFESDPNVDGFVFSAHTLTTIAGDGMGEAARTLVISRGDMTDFSFDSGFIRAMVGKNATATLIGYQDNVAIAVETLRVRDSRDTAFTPLDPDFGAIDRLEITVDGGMLVDDLIFTV